jgi:hypothetical protein
MLLCGRSAGRTTMQQTVTDRAPPPELIGCHHVTVLCHTMRRSHDRAVDPDGSRRGLRRDSPSANPTSPLPHTALQRASLGIGATPAVTE